MNQYGYGQPQPMYNPQTQNAYGFNTPYVFGMMNYSENSNQGDM